MPGGTDLGTGLAGAASMASPFGQIGAAAGGIGSLLGSLNQIFAGAKNRKMANNIHPLNPVYNINPFSTGTTC